MTILHILHFLSVEILSKPVCHDRSFKMVIQNQNTMGLDITHCSKILSKFQIF